MNTDNRIQPTGPAAEAYLPYFYHSGLFLHYPEDRARSSPRPYAGGRADYDFSSFAPATAGFREPQTVEQIIARGYFAVPQSEPTTALIADKRETSWLGLDDVIHQIHSRIQIYARNMYELSLAQCEANNGLFRQEADQGHPADARQRYAANKQIQKLYEEQRAERVNLWRDVARIRTTLPELAQNYLAAYRKLSILNDLQGESP